VRPGRLRVRVVVEVETLLVRWFHPGHLRGHLFFNSIRAQSQTRSSSSRFLDQREKKYERFSRMHEEKFLHQKVVKFLDKSIIVDKFDSLFGICDECTTCMRVLLELQMS
jgi:hypothetical protein